MSPKRPPRLATERLVPVATGLVIVAVLGLAVWSVSYSAADATPTVERNVSERYDAIESVDATRTTVIERNGTVTSRATYDATLVPATGERRLRLVDNGSERYDRRVSNGSVLWLHDTDDATVTRVPLSGPSADADTGQRVQQLLVRAGLVANDTGAPPTVEPLPVVPERAGRPVATATNYDVQYAGTETVDGREAYVLNVSARSNASAYSQRLWIDTEWFYPLQRQTVWTDDGVRTRLTTTSTDVRFNPPVPDGTFRPSIGPNTTVETVETPETATYREPSALRAATTISVPEPDIPPSYELTYATHTDGAVRGVGLRYVNRTSRITVSKYNFTYADEDSNETVTVDGRPATVSIGPTTSVSWSCDTYRYTVRGSGVTTGQIVGVAQSVGCP